MAIPEQFIEELTARADIVDVIGQYIHLTQKSGSYWGLCPFHHEKTPSFHVEPGKQIFHCFGCNKGGGMFRFIMEMENLSYSDAVYKVAKQYAMEVPEERNGSEEWRKRKSFILTLNREAARFYRENLTTPDGARVADYIRSRAVSPKFSARFGLGAASDAWDTLIRAMTAKGYDKQDLLDAGLAVAGKNGGIYDKFRNRLMLPVIDVRGDVIGFTSRVMDDSAPKYLNTPETSIFKKRSILYGLNYAKNTKRSNLILVEGNMDVITLHQAGLDNAVATMGTALTEEHINILSRYTKELVLCYDNDGAGEEATQRALGLLKNSDLSVKVLRLPRRRTESGELVKQDADDFIKNQGAEAFEGLMNRSENSVEYRLGAVRGKFDLDVDEQRADYLLEAAALIASLPSPVEREVYAGRAAAEARVSREAMLQEVDRVRKKRLRDAKKQQERRDLTPAQQLQPKERELRYRNLRSARAEESLLRIVLLDGEYFRQLEGLEGSQFSSPLLGKAFDALKARWREHRPVTLSALDGLLTPAEADHLAAVANEPQNRNTAGDALRDCVELIRRENGGGVDDADGLLALQKKLKEKKGYGGNDHE